jgi:hypothetical protein
MLLDSLDSFLDSLQVDSEVLAFAADSTQPMHQLYDRLEADPTPVLLDFQCKIQGC